MKKFGLPLWLPYPNAWLNALILSVFMTGLAAGIRRIGFLDSYLAKWSEQPELSIVVLILLIILPIPAIALFHHFFLSRFIPVIPGERVNMPQGMVPGVMSWWESLYSWLVFVLSSLIATLFCIPFLSLFKFNYEKIIYTYNQPHKNVQVLFAIVWIVSAAILYQIQYLFKDRLLFADEAIDEPTNVKEDLPVEIQPENVQDDVSATRTQLTEQAPKKKTNVAELIAKYRKLPQRLFTLVLISIVALWVYSFTNLPQVKQTLSVNLSSIEKQLIATPEPPPPPLLENDTYQKGVNKAKSAIKLTKSAQSEDEWRIVARRWEDAIKLMENVPTSSPNYGLAQQKILQYQVHREFAKQMLAGSY
ncbi:hypothetical protein NUACC21_80900 [Scytonema sp. NUACC21]